MSMSMGKLLFRFLGLLLCTLLCFVSTEAGNGRSPIKQLPGFNGTFPSKHYSGYVNVDGKQLFYYFVVSERKPSKDPVVLWLNGGPGCSSFDGFVYEHGPFNFKAGKEVGSLPTLHLNRYSWSKVSNIIYLDSPAGVGFSYADNITKYNTSDLTTAADSHSFLLKWFELFPEFVKNPFYITGESYAGIYVPTLAAAVVKGIKDGAKPNINLKGYMVGNGVADDDFDSNSFVPFAHGMGLISDNIFEEVNANCKGQQYYDPSTVPCRKTLLKINRILMGINIYDILEPCYHKPEALTDERRNKTSLPLSFQQLGVTKRPLPVRTRMFGRAWPLWSPRPAKDGIVTLWPELATNNANVPCTNDEVATAWLNDKHVREALHAKPASVSGPWVLCTDRINYRSDTSSMIPYHKKLTAQGYRALIYSGDHDLCVPYTGTEGWTRSIGYKIVDEWRPWMTNNQVAGFLQEYAHNLTFLTVKGSGHTVPEYKPKEALHFYSRWLKGKTI